MLNPSHMKRILLMSLAVILISFGLMWLPLQATTPVLDSNQAHYAPASTQPVHTDIIAHRWPQQQNLTGSAFLINDGSFEDIPSAWTETINQTLCGSLSKINDWSSVFDDITAYDGSRYLWLGGACTGAEESTPLVNTAEQWLVVPHPQATLSFWYYAARYDPDSIPNDDFAYVEINGQRVWELPLTHANNTNGWMQQTINLSQYAGNEVLLRFGNQANLNDPYVGNVLIDFVTFLELPATSLIVSPEEGGTLVYTDSLGRTTTIEVPPGAVESATLLLYQPLAEPEFPFPPGFLYANQAFDLHALGNLLYLPLVRRDSAASLTQSEPLAATRTTAAVGSFDFLLPIQITLEYRDEDLNGIDENSLVLLYWDGEEWQDALTTCDEPDDYIRDPDENFISLEICHLSRFGMVGN